MSEIFKNQIKKASTLIEAMPYLQEFRGKTFLIKIGGSAMNEDSLLKNLLRDVVFMELAGINPVIVHGGGKFISKAIEESGLKSVFSGGLRVTTDETIEIVEKVLNEDINTNLVNGIKNFGGHSTGIVGSKVFKSERIKQWSKDSNQEIDLGRVGKVVSIDLEHIQLAFEKEIVPVISPISLENSTGLTLNVNADLAASALASKLKATKLIYLSDVLGILKNSKDESSLITTLNYNEAEDLIKEEIIREGMIPKVRSSVEAINKGVDKIHMIDGRIPHSLLLEIFTEEGIGTQIIK